MRGGNRTRRDVRYPLGRFTGAIAAGVFSTDIHAPRRADEGELSGGEGGEGGEGGNIVRLVELRSAWLGCGAVQMPCCLSSEVFTAHGPGMWRHLATERSGSLLL